MWLLTLKFINENKQWEVIIYSFDLSSKVCEKCKTKNRDTIWGKKQLRHRHNTTKMLNVKWRMIDSNDGCGRYKDKPKIQDPNN